MVVETGGIGFKVMTAERTSAKLKKNEPAEIYCHLHLRDDGADLYGFLSPDELSFFELLISVSGVGPKSALAVMDVAELKDLAAAIKEGRPDLLTRASGVGRKTGERIVLELRGKVISPHSEESVKKMQTDSELLETLVDLGYGKDSARAALEKVDGKISDLGIRFKEALKILSGK